MAAAEATSYVGLYTEMADLLGGEYGRYLGDFDSESDIAPAALRGLCINAGNDTPKVYLYMPRGGTQRIKVLHRVTRYAPALGVPTDWDSGVFAFGSDVSLGNQITTVIFPSPTAFSRTGYIRAPTQAHMADMWDAYPKASCVGPYDADAPHTENVRTRFLTPVPKAYVPLVMGQPNWKPRDLWTALTNSITADGRLQACAPLLKWVRVAATLTPGTEHPAVTIDPLEVPHADEWLYR